MKKFLIIQARPEDEVSDNEYRAFLKYGGLSDGDTHRIRIEQHSIKGIDIDNYSGVIIGGSPFNTSDPEDIKTNTQKRAEQEMFQLMKEIVDKDFPFLGNCYGLGVLASYLETDVVSSMRYGENIKASEIKLTPEGKNDPLLEGVPYEFKAFVGHKEALQVLPPGAVHLASAEGCPFEMIKVKNNIYGVQFHTELDAGGLEIRIKIYKNHGYFPPETAEDLIAKAYQETITAPMKILKNFIKIYKTPLS